MLRIETLGRLSIERDGAAVDNLASSKAEALLVYLARTGQEHPRELLVELLWEDRPHRRAMGNLRVVLSSLRKEVGHYLTIKRTTAAVAQEADLWLDASQLEEAVAVVHQQDGVPSQAVAEKLAEAIALYKGDFLAGFFIPKAASFENWVAAERKLLHRLGTRALLALGASHLGQAQYGAAIGTSTRLLELDPLTEGGGTANSWKPSPAVGSVARRWRCTTSSWRNWNASSASSPPLRPGH